MHLRIIKFQINVLISFQVLFYTLTCISTIYTRVQVARMDKSHPEFEMSNLQEFQVPRRRHYKIACTLALKLGYHANRIQ